MGKYTFLLFKTLLFTTFLSNSQKKIVFVTHQPCALCAKRIINLGGVETIYYHEEYRLKDGVEFLNKAHIQVIHYKLEKMDLDELDIEIPTIPFGRDQERDPSSGGAAQ